MTWDNRSGPGGAGHTTRSLTLRIDCTDWRATAMVPNSCSLPDCELPRQARGYCNRHYQMWHKHGDPHWSRPSKEQAFQSRVDRSGTCWEWLGHVNNVGYGWTGTELAHRVSYQLHKGPIAPDKFIDHLCRNRSCVNPDHLEVVTPSLNFLRGIHPNAVTARTGFCQRGHEMVGENLYIVPKTGHRRCRACVSLRKQEHKARKAA